jgi:hypothetical protein
MSDAKFLLYISLYKLNIKGSGNSSIGARNNHANIVEPILKRPPVYRNSYSDTDASTLFYYPGYTSNYPTAYNENYSQTGYYLHASGPNVSVELLTIL